MGIVFKAYRPDTYCAKCNTTFYRQVGAFSEMFIERPLECSSCGELLYLLTGYYVKYYYVLRGTNLKIPATSLLAKIFIRIPAFILMSIPFLLVTFWVIDVTYYATTEAIKNALLVPMWLRLYDTDWPSFCLLLLIIHFLFQAAGVIYNYKKLEKYRETIDKTRDKSV